MDTSAASLALLISLVVLGPIAVPVASAVLMRRNEARQDRHLREHGRTISGSITGLHTDPGDGGLITPGCWAEVSCHEDGQQFTARIPLTGDQYKTLHVGSHLNVSYLPGQPQTARTL